MTRRRGPWDSLVLAVLTVLTTEGHSGMSVEQVAAECDRDSEHRVDRREIEEALRHLTAHKLASESPVGRWQPTPAALEFERLDQ
jgi:hypothetical protein